MSKFFPYRFIDLDIVEYNKAYDLQKFYVKEVIEGGSQVLIFCEHFPVITSGRLAKDENILFSKEYLKENGVDYFPIDRGGDVTLHVPGQLVVYPILRLENYKKDLHEYLHKLEQVVIDLLAEFDIMSERVSGKTGVWIDHDKIASIGVGVKKWVSFHGLGLNISTDLKYFKLIRPCDLDVRMISMEKIIGNQIDINEVKNKLLNIFERHFSLRREE